MQHAHCATAIKQIGSEIVWEFHNPSLPLLLAGSSAHIDKARCLIPNALSPFISIMSAHILSIPFRCWNHFIPGERGQYRDCRCPASLCHHDISSCGIDYARHTDPGGRFKKTYELLNLRALKISPVNKIHIFQCMGKIFCVEFQRYPLKFHTKYLTHTLKDTIFIQHWNFKSS